MFLESIGTHFHDFLFTCPLLTRSVHASSSLRRHLRPKKLRVSPYLCAQPVCNKRCQPSNPPASNMVPKRIFPADPNLSYPYFNTYRLISDDVTPSFKPSEDSQGTATSSCSFSLPIPDAFRPTLQRAGSQLGYKEIKARVGWNHVAVGRSENELVFVDKELKVVKLALQVSADRSERYRVSHSWIQSQQGEVSVDFETIHALPIPVADTSDLEVPSVLTRDSDYIATAGFGSLSIIGPTDVRELDLLVDGKPSPFLLHAWQDDEVIVSRTIRTFEEQSKSRYKTSYEILCVVPGVDKLDIKWTLKGEERPRYVRWVHGRWLIGAEGFYRKEAAVAQDTPKPVAPPSGQHPYEWTQTASSVVITFYIPDTFQASRDISCVIHPHQLDLQLFPRGGEVSASLKAFLETQRRDWWDTVDKEESTWTWEKTSAKKGMGALTLHLEKANSGNTWSQVFSPQNENEVEVPQTMSAEEADAVRASLDKFTGEMDGKMDQSATALPGLLREEMEDEEPETASRGGELVFTYDSTPQDGIIPVKMLSTSLNDDTIIIKGNVDGHVFAPTADASWKHLSTNPALSFVLASKRDVHFTFHLMHDNLATVLAFESRGAAGGNIYVYWPIEDEALAKSGKRRAETGRQGVIKYGEEAGSIVGVRRVRLDGRDLLIAIGEHAIIVLHDI